MATTCDDPGPYILNRDPFDEYVRTADPRPPSLWPALIAALFVIALVLSPFLLVRPAHSQTPQCGGNTVSAAAMVEHYAPEVDADHKLYAISKGAQPLNLALAKVSGATILAGTPPAVAIVALVSEDATIVYVFAADGCSMAHGLVDPDTWNQVVAEAKAELIEIVLKPSKAPPPNAPSRNGA